MPTYFKENEPYTYTKTIASKIFNFSTTLSGLDCHQLHNSSSQCKCNTSSHLYQPYYHVTIGDLSIIPNSKLRDLIAKGSKYRESYKVDWDKYFSLLCEAVDWYALQWDKREMVELLVLSSWKEMVKGQIEERISKLKSNFKQPSGKLLKLRMQEHVYLTYIVSMLSYQQIKLQTILYSYVKGITLRLCLKNWDWIIAPLQQETRHTLHVKCCLKTLSILMIFT